MITRVIKRLQVSSYIEEEVFFMMIPALCWIRLKRKICMLLVSGTTLTESPRENHRPAASHWQTLSRNVVSSTSFPWVGFKLTTLVVVSTDCTGSCKSNYHMITTTTSLIFIWFRNIIVFWCLKKIILPAVFMFINNYMYIHGDVYWIQQYVIKFVSDLRELKISPPIKLTATI